MKEKTERGVRLGLLFHLSVRLQHKATTEGCQLLSRQRS